MKQFKGLNDYKNYTSNKRHAYSNEESILDKVIGAVAFIAFVVIVAVA